MKSIAAGFAVLLLAVPVAACAEDAAETFRRTTPEYAELGWIAAEGEAGRRRLEIEAAFDPVAREYLERYPGPDRLKVFNEGATKIAYLDRDRVVVFLRWQQPTSIVVRHPILDPDFQALSAPDREQVEQARARMVTGFGSRGTCFLVHPDGYLITAYHGFRNRTITDVQVTLSDASTYDGELVSFLDDQDIALLKIPGIKLPYLPFADPEQLRMGRAIFTVGFPAPFLLGDTPKYAEGAISSPIGRADRKDLLLMTIPIQAGNSGGPVIDFRGEIVGVIMGSATTDDFVDMTGTLPQSVNWATRPEFASSLFEAPPPLPPAASREDAIERARQAICQLDIRREKSPPVNPRAP